MTKEDYKKEFHEVEKKFDNKLAKLYVKMICGHCKYNYDGHCIQWHRNLKKETVRCCSCFEVNE